MSKILVRWSFQGKTKLEKLRVQCENSKICRSVSEFVFKMGLKQMSNLPKHVFNDSSHVYSTLNSVK